MNVNRTNATKFSPYQTTVLALLSLLQFMVMLDFMIISPIGYILTADLQMSTGQFGLVVSSYIFSAAASGIISAAFSIRTIANSCCFFSLPGLLWERCFAQLRVRLKRCWQHEFLPACLVVL